MIQCVVVDDSCATMCTCFVNVYVFRHAGLCVHALMRVSCAHVLMRVSCASAWFMRVSHVGMHVRMIHVQVCSCHES